MEEIRQTCEAIQGQVGKELFYSSTTRQDNRLPQLNDFVDKSELAYSCENRSHVLGKYCNICLSLPV